MTRPAPAPHPWDLQPGETSLAYQAFQCYRDMGPGRTLKRVSEALGKSEAFLSRWSFRNGWVARAESFDAEAARIASARSLNDHAEVRARQAGLGRMMQARGAQRIGQLDPAVLEAKEARMLAVEGAKMEREALGLAAKLELTGKDGGPVEVRDVTEIDARAARILAALLGADDEITDV